MSGREIVLTLLFILMLSPSRPAPPRPNATPPKFCDTLIKYCNPTKIPTRTALPSLSPN